MNTQEKLGAFSGLIAAVGLSELNLWVGLAAAFFTLVCLVPTAFEKWRCQWIRFLRFKRGYCPKKCCKPVPCLFCYAFHCTEDELKTDPKE